MIESNVIVRIGQLVVAPLIALSRDFFEALPAVIGGLIVLAFGYLLGEVLEIVIIKGLKKLKVDNFIHSLKISKNLEKFEIPHFVGVMVKWYVFVVFLVPAASLAGLGNMTILLVDFARWVPNFILAVFIVLFGWIGADVLVNKIEATKVKSKHLISMSVRTLIIIFVMSVALEQIGVSMTLLYQTFLIILGAVAFGFALAIGLGFGLAMKDDAKKTIADIRKKMK